MLDFDDDGRLALLLGAACSCRSPLGILVLAQRAPGVALNPLVAAGDLASLALILALVPASYAAIQFCALVLALAYPLVRGELRGALFAIAVVAIARAGRAPADPPVESDRLVFYQLIFAVADDHRRAVRGPRWPRRSRPRAAAPAS